MVKFPNASLDISTINGNAFSVMGHAVKVMRKVGASEEDISNYRNAAMSGDYGNLLRVTMEYINVTGSEDDED